MPEDTLDQLVALSNRLGDPAHDYVILGEGNTSARADAGSFWVKASGAELRTAGRSTSRTTAWWRSGPARRRSRALPPWR